MNDTSEEKSLPPSEKKLKEAQNQKDDSEARKELAPLLIKVKIAEREEKESRFGLEHANEVKKALTSSESKIVATFNALDVELQSEARRFDTEENSPTYAYIRIKRHDCYYSKMSDVSKSSDIWRQNGSRPTATWD